MRHRERQDSKPLPIYLGQTKFEVYPYDGAHFYIPSIKNVYYDLAAHDSVCLSKETCDDELHHGPPWKDGGPFDVVKMETDQHEVSNGLVTHSGKYWYTGGFMPSTFPTEYLDWTDPVDIGDWGDVASYGASAWNRFKPAKPSVDLGVALGEIHELPRMLKTTAKGFANLWRSMGGSPTGFGPKNVANHWLNTQFGWIPFLNDLRDFYETTSNLDKKLNQLRRDNGRWIRRGGAVGNSNEASVLNSGSGVSHYPGLETILYASDPDDRGDFVVREQRTQSVWFSGAFRYWIPGDETSFLWKGRAVAMLYGLQPSPSLIYNLTPWSWLLDWCTNTGDVVSNISDIALNNLCSKYAYVMGTTEQKVVVDSRTNLSDGQTVTDSRFASICRKQRVEASAFGFSLSSDEFSARQRSILAALGISRLS